MAAVWSKLGSVSVDSVQALSEAAPVSILDGMDLAGAGTCLPLVIANNGQTLTGGGWLRCYYYSRQLGIWMPHQRLDQELVDVGGAQYGPLEPFPIIHNDGKLAFIADSIGVTGGTTVRVVMLATDRLTRTQI